MNKYEEYPMTPNATDKQLNKTDKAIDGCPKKHNVNIVLEANKTSPVIKIFWNTCKSWCKENTNGVLILKGRSKFNEDFIWSNIFKIF